MLAGKSFGYYTSTNKLEVRTQCFSNVGSPSFVKEAGCRLYFHMCALRTLQEVGHAHALDNAVWSVIVCSTVQLGLFDCKNRGELKSWELHLELQLSNIPKVL